eukprot:381143_1
MDEKDELIELRNKLIETERQLQAKCEENTQLKELNNVLSNKGATPNKGQYAKVLDELIELRNKLIETERQLQAKCEENTQLKELNNVLSNKGATPNKGQYAKVLDEMYRLCLSDADAVISLIRNKTINVVDVDSKGKTLLLIASSAGSYEIVNLCLNLGADITHNEK